MPQHVAYVMAGIGRENTGRRFPVPPTSMLPLPPPKPKTPPSVIS